MTQPCRYRIIYLIILNKRISIKIRVITINKLSPIIFRSVTTLTLKQVIHATINFCSTLFAYKRFVFGTDVRNYHNNHSRLLPVEDK